MRELLERLSPIVTQVIGMTRAFVDHYDEALADEPTVRAIAEQLRRAAHDVRLAVHIAEVDPEPLTSAIPALTAPLVIAPADVGPLDPRRVAHGGPAAHPRRAADRRGADLMKGTRR